MSMTGLTSFDRTLHQSNTWLNRLSEELGFGDRQQAYHALRAVLHPLRDRLTLVEVAELSAQLPMLLRGVFFEGWSPSPDGRPTGSRRSEDFLASVSASFTVRPEHIDPRALVDAVLRLLDDRVSPGEMDDVRRVLPTAIRDLWPAHGGAW